MKITLLFLLVAVRQLTAAVPAIAYAHSFQTYSYAAFPNDSCSKLTLTPNYFVRLGSNNVISAVNKSSFLQKATLLNYSYTLSSTGALVRTGNLILDFDVDQNESYLTIAQTTATRILNFSDFTLKATSSASPFYKILFSKLVLTANAHDPIALNDKIYQKTIALGGPMASTKSAIFTLTANYSLPNVKNCKSKESPDRSILLYWDDRSNVFVFNNSNASVVPAFLGTLTGNATQTGLTQTIAFSADSLAFIMEADAALPVRVVSLAPSSFLAVRSFAFSGVINKAMFLDAQSAFIALFNDTSITFFESASLSLLFSSDFDLATEHIEIDYSTGLIYVCKSSSVDVYDSAMVNCSTNCRKCINESDCEVCADGYEVVNGRCELIPPTADPPSYNDTANAAANSTNAAAIFNTNFSMFSPPVAPAYQPSALNNFVVPSTVDPSPTNQTVPINNENSSNLTSNDTLPQNQTQNASNPYFPTQNSSLSNQTDTNNSSDPGSAELDFNVSMLNTSNPNQTYLILEMPDGTVMIFEVTYLQSQIINATADAISHSNGVVSHLMVVLASSPFIYLFLGNLQFFTISSLYVLLQVPVPSTIAETLNSTAAALSSNLLTAIGVSFTVPAVGTEHETSQRLLEFGVSSLFLPNNYQFLLLSTITMALLYTVRALLRAFRSGRFLSILLDHNKLSVIFGLVVSAMTQIVLPYKAVYGNAWSASFSDKINQFTQFTVVGTTLAFGALYVAFTANLSHRKSQSASSKHKSILQSGLRTEGHQIDCRANLRRQRDEIYLVLLNLCFPAFVVLSDPIIFLTMCMALLLLGLYNASISAKFKANKVVLSVYPIVFHLCFAIFNFSRDPTVLIITQIVCLLTYFMGSLHELLTIAFTLFHLLYRLVLIKYKESKVQPVSQETEGTVATWHWKRRNLGMMDPQNNNRMTHDIQRQVKKRMNIVHEVENGVELFKISLPTLIKDATAKPTPWNQRSRRRARRQPTNR